MNPVLILTHNNLHLVKRCIESIQKQDLTTMFYVIDNGSKDGTPEWIQSQFPHNGSMLPDNTGVTWGWNFGIRTFLEGRHQYRSDHILVVGSDTVLPPWFYRCLLGFNLPFVTGVAVDQMSQLIEPEEGLRVDDPHPDFSAFLIRRDCWEKVGPFDERMKLYASDCDFHVRAHRLGIPLWKASVPFYHERSSTLRLASPAEQAEIQEQANKDREVFKSIYGCLPGTKEYEQLFETVKP